MQDDIKEIVEMHNKFRRKVAKGYETRGVNGPQPKATDMYELVWDPILSTSAQRLVLIFWYCILFNNYIDTFLVIIN